MKNIKLSIKLISGFLIVAAITLMVGIVGWRGAVSLDHRIHEVGVVRLPSVESVLRMQESIMEIQQYVRTLLSPNISREKRFAQHELVLSTRNDLQRSMEKYEPLPRTIEEDILWKKFVPAYESFTSANNEVIRMSIEVVNIGIDNPYELLGNLNQFRGDHYAIMMKVRNHIDFDTVLEGEEDPDACDFSKWMKNIGTDNLELNKIIQQMGPPHRDFHGYIPLIKELVAEDRHEEARLVLNEQMYSKALEVFEHFDEMIQVTGLARDYFYEMVKYVLGDADQAVSQGVELLDQIAELNSEIAAQEVSRAEADAAYVKLMVILGMIIGTFIAVILGVILTLSITRPIFKGVEFAKDMADGLLTRKLDIEQKDEVGQLADALNNMVGSLRNKIREILDVSNYLRTSSEEIAASISQVTSGAQETATSVMETTATVQEVNQTSEATSKKAGEVAESARHGLELANFAKQSMEELFKGMQTTNEQMSWISETIMKLSEQSQAIGEITSTVDDIAEQTNLLAVNAAIEAAKAGEQGKGFSVVAQEIKSLAEQSKQATRQVRAILDDIRKATGTAVMATEKGTKAVDQGLQDVGKTKESIITLNRSFADSAQSAAQIAAASKEQFAGMDQVNQAMDNIREASEQNVVSMQQLDSSAQKLREFGHKLKELMEQYKL
jgi:methyl-accepting chemotaxis protein